MKIKPCFKFTNDVLPGCWFYLFFDEEKYLKWCEQEYIQESVDCLDGRVRWLEKNGINIICVYLKNRDDSIIIHEALHATWFLLDCHNIQVDVDNHEVLAYYQGWLYKEIKKRLEKYESCE